MVGGRRSTKRTSSEDDAEEDLFDDNEGFDQEEGLHDEEESEHLAVRFAARCPSCGNGTNHRVKSKTTGERRYQCDSCGERFGSADY
jgi:predicted RNA-binding Zn-ribbon protein involved in translation (DUF1610 family)